MDGTKILEFRRKSKTAHLECDIPIEEAFQIWTMLRTATDVNPLMTIEDKMVVLVFLAHLGRAIDTAE